MDNSGMQRAIADQDLRSFDAGLAKRQNEINQWEVGNKMDTLFIYQQMLIILSAVIIMTYLLKNGILTTTVFRSITGILAAIFAFTVANRAQWTDRIRDTRYWNKRQFPVNMVPIPTLSVCD
jgi:uncharacterized membrane protein